MDSRCQGLYNLSLYASHSSGLNLSRLTNFMEYSRTAKNLNEKSIMVPLQLDSPQLLFSDQSLV